MWAGVGVRYPSGWAAKMEIPGKILEISHHERENYDD
jgi:hypothetical protein